MQEASSPRLASVEAFDNAVSEHNKKGHQFKSTKLVQIKKSKTPDSAMSKIAQYLRAMEPHPGESPQSAAEVCDRLIRWLANLDISQKRLNRADVALLLEAASILHLNIIAFGTHLTQELLQRWGESDTLLKTFYQTLSRSNPVVYIAEQVLQLNRCEEHLPAVREAFSSILNLRRLEDTIEKITLKQTDPADEPQADNETNQEAAALLNKIFRLRNDHIPEAIKRLADFQCSGIKFGHIAHILMDPPNSITYKKSLIFKEQISKSLDDGQIGPRFISSIAEECSMDEENAWLLLKCLKVNKTFASSLSKFLINFLSSCKYDDLRKNFYSPQFIDFDIANIFLIVGVLLSHRSHIRIVFARGLFSSDSKIEWRLRQIVKKQNFLFDY